MTPTAPAAGTDMNDPIEQTNSVSIVRTFDRYAPEGMDTGGEWPVHD